MDVSLVGFERGPQGVVISLSPSPFVIMGAQTKGECGQCLIPCVVRCVAIPRRCVRALCDFFLGKVVPPVCVAFEEGLRVPAFLGVPVHSCWLCRVGGKELKGSDLVWVSIVRFGCGCTLTVSRNTFE